MKTSIFSATLIAFSMFSVHANEQSNHCESILKKESKWSGEFIQQGKKGNFFISLSSYSKSSGVTGFSEEKDIRPGKSEMVGADWTGRVSGNQITMMKIYRVANTPPVKYSGVCNKANQSISGSWTIDEMNNGTFIMTANDDLEKK